MATTTTTQIPSALSEYYDKLLLSRALPLIVHDKWGQRRDIPVHNSGTIKFRRYESLSADTTPLAEGTPPTAIQLSKTDITANVAGYGAVVEITDKVTLLNVEDVVSEAVELIGEQAANTLDQVYREVLVAGSNVVYANSKTARNEVVDVPSTTDFDKIITLLKAANVKPFTDVIPGADRYNTTPIPAAYWAIVHPHVWKTLKGLTGFVPVHKYPNPAAAIPGEVGAYENIRFVESTNARIWAGAGGSSTSVRNTAGSANVYATLIFGKEAYGITNLQGNGMKTYIKPLGSGGTADPLDQKTTVGWKAYTVCKILNDSFMVRFESAAPL